MHPNYDDYLRQKHERDIERLKEIWDIITLEIPEVTTTTDSKVVSLDEYRARRNSRRSEPR